MSTNKENDNIDLSEIFNFNFENKEQEEIDNYTSNNQNNDLTNEISIKKTCSTLKYDYDGWFLTSIQTNQLLTQKLGPNRLKQSIEYYYFHKNYKEALKLSLEYIDFVEGCNNKENNELNPNRLTSTRDMLEIAARSASKLGDFELAVKCVDKLSSNEPGHMSFKGQIYAKGGRFSALLSFRRSLKIMTTSKWKTSILFVNSRYIKEKNQIEELIKQLEHIDAQEAFVWLKNQDESEIFEFNVDIIRWILMECKTNVNEVMEMDKERSVNQL
ncbi:5850_t:CDS:2 [Scutellospora calospora]|uniref:5850_t:CDS:1 n=1 Tax=Scutellospora calospora TaxID=85575 RepID=A0ACA9KR06_9GLOM|nr:5850_t:CDS:2 [Scutellospora calospora]